MAPISTHVQDTANVMIGISCMKTIVALMSCWKNRFRVKDVGMCGNPKVGLESVLEKPNRSQKVKFESRVSVAF